MATGGYMRISIPGHGELMGRAEQIVRLMNDAQFFETMKTEDAYMDRTRDNVERLFNQKIMFRGNTLEERAQSFLESLDRHGLIKIEKREEE